MKIQSVKDKSFRKYGRVLEDMDFCKICQICEEKTNIPKDVVYVPSEEALEELPISRMLSEHFYGGMPIQIGYCNGYNDTLNALEYHRGTEVNIAARDMILLLGSLQDVEDDYTYDTALVEAFLVPKETAVSLYETTLHYAPCGVNGDGFKCIVVLPKGTNYDVEIEPLTKEDKLLAATNKWLIAHKDAGIDGAFVGLRGENIRI